ncbi:YajG family lipoprotein [Spiribacter sp. 2438]|uniref:YajG family lipoprotein n=1 Tax=Spiribacter sp. 2438 TaxID=2666185 RepID=UPI0018A1CD32|nr:YajG family lipoprotein [Spiribacter sp. 2438]
MKRFIAAALMLGALVVLAGCAQSTQELRLSPAAPSTGPLIGNGQSLAFEVVDGRDNTDLGRQENIDGETIRIQSDKDIAYAVQLAAAEALRGYDFQPTLWDGGREPRLRIRIEELDHQVTAGVPFQLETRIGLEATAWRGGERYRTRARTTLTDQRALPPREGTNTEVIDEAITRALGELLNRELANFLAGRN